MCYKTHSLRANDVLYPLLNLVSLSLTHRHTHTHLLYPLLVSLYLIYLCVYLKRDSVH